MTILRFGINKSFELNCYSNFIYIKKYKQNTPLSCIWYQIDGKFYVESKYEVKITKLNTFCVFFIKRHSLIARDVEHVEIRVYHV